MKYFVFLIPMAFSLLSANAQVQVYFNAKIFTANKQQPFANTLAVNGKTIVAVGDYHQVKNQVGESAEWIDLQGGFVMPGLVDSHNHGIDGGIGLTKANVNDSFLTIEQIYDYASEIVAKKEGMTGDVLIVYGLHLGTWKELDKINSLLNSGIFATQPLVLRGSDWHTGWCNKAMLKRAGVNKAYLASLAGDEKKYFALNSSGESNGFITETGFEKIDEAIEKETDFSEAAIKTMQYNNAFGITAWLDPSVAALDDSSSNLLDWYRYLSDKGLLSAHVVATVVANANKAPLPQIAALKSIKQRYDSGNFSVIGFKIFADGVVEHPTHTAALSQPYTGTSSKGVLMIDPKKFAHFATEADKAGLLVHVHAIGDLAVSETLNGFEEVRAASKNLNIPHTITHLQFVQPSDFHRFAGLNVLASFQLLWALGDATTIDIVQPYISPEIYKWQYPARSMLQAGAVICGASDWPVSTANPFEAMYYAETRKGEMGVLDSTQRMPRLAMLNAYTSDAAKALMMENEIGTLEIGKSADFVLLDRDVLTVEPELLKQTRVVWTVFEGRKVYEMER